MEWGYVSKWLRTIAIQTMPNWLEFCKNDRMGPKYVLYRFFCQSFWKFPRKSLSKGGKKSCRCTAPRQPSCQTSVWRNQERPVESAFQIIIGDRRSRKFNFLAYYRSLIQVTRSVPKKRTTLNGDTCYHTLINVDVKEIDQYNYRFEWK